MANYEINEEQEVLTKAMRMIETGDPVHADVYNVLFSALLNNDVFLEKLANKMVQQAMISHVMDSTNSNMVLGADQGPVITKLIDKVQEQVTVLNTKTGSYTHEYEKFTETVLGKYVQYSFYGRPWTFSNLPVPNGNTNLSFVVSLVGSKISIAHMNIDTDGRVSLYDQDWSEISASSGILIRGTIGYCLKIQ